MSPVRKDSRRPFLFELGAILGLALLFPRFASAVPITTITPNGLGTSVMPSTPGYYNIQGGTSAGSNLFHSFSTFNLGTGDTADFNVTSGISNILARVTGGPSTIDGTITSTNVTTGILSSANLFFLNPAGVMFTANAQVNLGGSFIVSTANYVKLNDGNIFYADINHPIADAGLTSAPVSAFGFLTSAPQPVSFEGSQFQMQQGTGLHVIGGDINVDFDANLFAPSGALTLFSAAAAGEVPFSLASPGSGYATAPFAAFGNITIQNFSKLAIDGPGGGNMVIRGGHIVVDSSTISSANSGSIAGGNISIQGDSMTMINAAQITSSTTGTGAGGDISVTANNLDIEGFIYPYSDLAYASPGYYPTGIFSNTLSSGNSGNVNIDVTNLFTIVGFGGVESSTGSLSSISAITGKAGDIDVQAGALDVDGEGALLYSMSLVADFGDPSSGIDSTCLGEGTTGASGGVTVNVQGELQLTLGGTIATSTEAYGNAGDLNVTADSAIIAGYAGGTGFFEGPPSGILAETIARGKAGSVNVDVTKNLAISGFGGVDATTFSPGDAGNVLVKVDSLSIDGSGALSGLCGVSSSSIGGSIFKFPSLPDEGNAGTVEVDAAHSITVANGGFISAVTYSSGNAGDVTVNALSLSIQGDSSGTEDATGVFTGNLSLNGISGTGKAGLIKVNVEDALTISGYGGIDASTYSGGEGGDIMVHSGTMDIEGSPTPPPSTIETGNAVTGISSSSFMGSSGQAGSITVDVDNALHISGYGAGITVLTASSGNAGDINVTAGSIDIEGEGVPADLTGIIAASTALAMGNAGSIMVDVATTLNIADGGEISSNSNSTMGNGGDVTVSSNQDITLSGSGVITASSQFTHAGSINVTAGDSLSLGTESTIDTSAGTDGGSITLNVSGMVYLLDSEISATAGTLKQAGVVGSGGNITIDPQFVVLDNSLISANAALGKGGNIQIITNDFLNTDSSVTATGSSDGTITISAPDLNLSGSLYALPAVLVSEDNRLREKCATAANHEFSSLIVVGRGGTESSPTELQQDYGDPRTLPKPGGIGRTSP